MEAKFQRAVNLVQTIPKSAESSSDEKKLMFYSLYKQATVGDINIPRPSLFNVIGRAKWDAWNRRKGWSKDHAKQAYIRLCDVTFPKWDD